MIRGIKIISEFLKTVKHGELKVDINDTSLNFSGKHVQGINHKGPIIKTDNWKIQTNLVWKQILMNRSATVTLNSWINLLVGDFVNYASQVMSFTHMFGRINNYKTP